MKKILFMFMAMCFMGLVFGGGAVSASTSATAEWPDDIVADVGTSDVLTVAAFDYLPDIVGNVAVKGLNISPVEEKDIKPHMPANVLACLTVNHRCGVGLITS